MLLRPDQIDQLKEARMALALNPETPSTIQTAGCIGELALDVMQEQETFVVPERAALATPPEISGMRWYSVQISRRERSYPLAFLQLSMNPENSQPVLLSEITLPASPDVDIGQLKNANPNGVYCIDWLGKKRGLVYPLQDLHGNLVYTEAAYRAAGWILSTAGTIHI